ncbi:MAG: transposase [Gammaproteobacteria bacterium]|nr:MAG: transposase [Gammaproteobacteria bacterium]
MPRRARLILPNVTVHVIQRGNNRQNCFYRKPDYRNYLEWLQEYAIECDCRIHAYVLMTNHVHLLATPARAESLGAMMKRLGQRYVQYVNRTYKRSGTLWEGRYKSCLVSDEAYVLGCYRYIELNPVRAGLIRHPAEYRWSSYRANSQGENNSIITPHELYLALDGHPEHRIAAYRELFRQQLKPELVEEIRQATNGNFVIGSKRFKRQIAQALGRRVTRGKPGRPSPNT